MQDLNDVIGEAIEEKYGTLSQYAKDKCIPYSTLSNIVKNGLENSRFSMIMQLCRDLDIDVFETEKLTLSDKELAFASKFSMLDESGGRLVSSIIEKEYDRTEKINTNEE